jgi:hypothetical protein
LKNYPIEKVIKGGLFLSLSYFILSLWALVYLPQHIFFVMGGVLFFCVSMGVIFYSLNRKAIEIKAPMGTITAVFSASMHLFRFLGSLAARQLNF